MSYNFQKMLLRSYFLRNLTGLIYKPITKMHLCHRDLHLTPFLQGGVKR